MKISEINRKMDLEIKLFSVGRDEWIKDGRGRTWTPTVIKVTWWDTGSVSWYVTCQLIKTGGVPGGLWKDFGPATLSDAEHSRIWELVRQNKPDLSPAAHPSKIL